MLIYTNPRLPSPSREIPMTQNRAKGIEGGIPVNIFRSSTFQYKSFERLMAIGLPSFKKSSPLPNRNVYEVGL